MAYDIVPYAPELEHQIVRLQTHLWGGDPVRNAAYLQWKYADNPYLDRPLIRVALCDGRAVAMRGLFGTLWEVDDGTTRHLLPYADDFVVVPEHRNRGVARQVMQASLDAASACGFPFAVNLSAGSVTFVSSLAAGWRCVGRYDSAWRVRRQIPWGRRDDSLSRASPPSLLFEPLDRAAERRSGPVSLARGARPQEMAALIARLPWDGRIRHVRDTAYLTWRFRNPLHAYRFLYWEEHGLQGYLVLQRYLSESADQRCVNIVDWEAADDHVRAGLLDAALDWGGFARVHVWTAHVREPVRAVLRERGFAAVPARGVREQSRGLLVRRLAPGPCDAPWRLGSRDLLEMRDWDLRMLYSTAG